MNNDAFDKTNLERRRFVQASLGVFAMVCLPIGSVCASEVESNLIHKVIPSTGEKIPAVGMGSWITFNVGDDVAARENCIRVLKAFFAAGGQLVDSSPMYGSSEEVIGFCLQQLKQQAIAADVFSATKVWTPFQSTGVSQTKASEKLWHSNRIDLQQIHNLVSWQEHLETLQQLKKDKRIRYIGITTSHGRRHKELEKIMKTQAIDFVQLTYNIVDTEVEQRLLPLAQERNIAVLVNRPFQRKGLFRLFGDKKLPSWASEIGCNSWAQFFLKFVISHPAVTCAIPATSQVAHMVENMAVLKGPLPDTATRAKMLNYIATI